jgi:DnaJ-class molecular chaperone
MAADDTLRERMEELERAVAELTDRLSEVSAERDAALHELSRIRIDGIAAASEAPSSPHVSDTDLVACSFCDGEGVYWVHDFEMKCKRCDGTGYGVRVAVDAPVDRH